MRGRPESRRNLLPPAAAAVALLAVVVGALPSSARLRQAGHRGQARAAVASKRFALVIGNNAYPAGPLKNPVNDARAIAQALRERDFDVTARENLSLNEMKQAIRAFGEKLRAAGGESVGLFYYAGHGVQVQDRNYLIPVDATIANEEEVEYDAVDVGFVMAQMDAARNNTNILILDACRDNPFARSFRSATRGLALMSAPTGILIAYATAPGATARDGSGANGLYTEELLSAMRSPGLPVEDVFKRVRVKVRERSEGQQVPWESSSLVGDFYFTPTGTASVTPTPTPTPRSAADDSTMELSFWDSIKNSTDPEEFKAYLEQYPSGRFAALARRRLAVLTAGATPTPTPAGGDRGRSDTSRVKTGALAQELTDRAGIALVLVPAGGFVMGSEDGEGNERPSHRVTIAAPFYLGKYEVTQEQWQKVMGGNPAEFKGADQPVEHVSWEDAQEFIRRLNALNDGLEYRLPTEAEWEYACRAGSTGDYAGELDSMAWYEKNSGGGTHPVGQKQPNRFGLYDMHGNVWEWCADAAPESNYSGAPSDGGAWNAGQKRILRGGSWDHDANHARSAFRHWFTQNRHTHGIGFRVAASPRASS